MPKESIFLHESHSFKRTPPTTHKVETHARVSVLTHFCKNICKHMQLLLFFNQCLCDKIPLKNVRIGMSIVEIDSVYSMI